MQSKDQGLWYESPKMSNPLEGSKCIDYFRYFLPVDYFKEVIMVQTNNAMKNGSGCKMTWGNFVQYIGLWILMSMVVYGGDRCSYFSQDPFSPLKGAPCRLDGYMTRWKFNRITSSLQLMDTSTPPYRDKFHKVMGLITA